MAVGFDAGELGDIRRLPWPPDRGRLSFAGRSSVAAIGLADAGESSAWAPGILVHTACRANRDAQRSDRPVSTTVDRGFESLRPRQSEYAEKGHDVEPFLAECDVYGSLAESDVDHVELADDGGAEQGQSGERDDGDEAKESSRTPIGPSRPRTETNRRCEPPGVVMLCEMSPSS